MRLCQLPRRPSELWALSDSGYSPAICLDFDFAVLDYWDDYQRHANEEKPVPAPKPLGKGMALGPKYKTNEEIFLLYAPPEPDEVRASDILEPEEIDGLLDYLDETSGPTF